MTFMIFWNEKKKAHIPAMKHLEHGRSAHATEHGEEREREREREGAHTPTSASGECGQVMCEGPGERYPYPRMINGKKLRANWSRMSSSSRTRLRLRLRYTVTPQPMEKKKQPALARGAIERSGPIRDAAAGERRWGWSPLAHTASDLPPHEYIM